LIVGSMESNQDLEIKILSIVESRDGVHLRELLTAIRVGFSRLRQVLEALEEKGEVVIKKHGGYTFVAITDNGRKRLLEARGEVEEA